MELDGPSKKGMTESKLPSSKKERRKKQRRIEDETNKVSSSKSGALSSYEPLYYHDIPPELIKRIAKRYTGGHKKYGVEHLNLNWRIGLDDPKYIAERFNHLMDHLLAFLEDGNEFDDNLGAMAWAIGCLMEAERHAPEAFKSVIGQCKLFGKTAKELQDKMRNKK